MKSNGMRRASLYQLSKRGGMAGRNMSKVGNIDGYIQALRDQANEGGDAKIDDS